MNNNNNGIGFAGVGMVSGYGWGIRPFWNGLCSGKPAARLVGGFGENHDETVWMAKIPDGGRPDDGDGLLNRAFRAAARESVEDAVARGWVPGERVALVQVGCLDDTAGWTEFLGGHARRNRDFIGVLPGTAASMFMKEYGFHGPSTYISATCSSTNNALLMAKLWLDAGKADDVIVVGADLSLTPEVVGGFTRLGAAVVDVEPLDACRPFQDGGRGFSPGECATGFVLSARAEDPYAQLLGGAMTSDAYHPTGMDPANTQLTRCVSEALEDAGVTPADVRYFNSHGTGTQQCSAAESGVIEVVFGAEEQPYIYALKPLVGHCLAGAGGIEVAAGLMSYEHGLVPAAKIVSGPAHPRLLDGLSAFEGGVTLKTSMGMGGYNSAIVIGPSRER